MIGAAFSLVCAALVAAYFAEKICQDTDAYRAMERSAKVVLVSSFLFLVSLALLIIVFCRYLVGAF